MRNANCFGAQVWTTALTSANSLASGVCGLTDGSSAGQWRLPNIVELESLVDSERFNPALQSGHPFSGVQADHYWSSSTYAASITYAWFVSMNFGLVDGSYKVFNFHVWPVRGGQ